MVDRRGAPRCASGTVSPGTWASDVFSEKKTGTLFKKKTKADEIAFPHNGGAATRRLPNCGRAVRAFWSS
jgi:hypothetical protein